MTHDKLLVKLMVMAADESEQTRLSKTTQALRAVVELHKPDIYETCVECTRGISPSIAYPCPTVQAIEKELV
jgi:hypothetical protein